MLIGRYEAKVYPIWPPDPVSMVRFVMEQRGLKQADLVSGIFARKSTAAACRACARSITPTTFPLMGDVVEEGA